MEEINNQLRKMILNSKWKNEDRTVISFNFRGDQILIINSENKIIEVINKLHSITVNEDCIDLFYADMNDCDENYMIYPLEC
jgi:hypothetical protein